MSRNRSRSKNKFVDLLIGKDIAKNIPYKYYKNDRENVASRMDETAKDEVRSLIEERYQSAVATTDQIALKMAEWDNQYKGIFNDPSVDPEAIFLPKTREQVHAVFSYLSVLLSQLDPLITTRPMVSSIEAVEEEYRRATVAEAMLNFYMDDVWKLRDDFLPRWLKTFLKYSLAVAKITYYEDAMLPDLRLELVDRAFLYIDPNAQDIKDAGWIIEKCFLTRSEVLKRIREGYWHLPENEYDFLIPASTENFSKTFFSTALLIPAP